MRATIVSIYGSENTKKHLETLVSLISASLFESGLNVFSFTEGETGIVKFDKEPFESRSIGESDYMIFLDDMDVKTAAKSAKKKSVAIFNLSKNAKYTILKKKKIKIVYLDATGIANSLFIHTPSSALAGAFAKMFGKIPLKRIKSEAGQLGDHHSKAAEEGYRLVK